MTMSISKRIAPTVLAISLAGGVVGLTASSAFAASKTHTITGTIKAISTGKLTVTVSKKSDSVTTTAKTTVKVAGKTSTVGDLKIGEKITAHYSVSGKKWIATSITSSKV